MIVPLGLLHHADHVLRADHSSWPFRPEVGPFTATLLIYPVLLLVFFASKHWVRVAGLGVSSLFTLLAHTLIEPPRQIYGTWANNLSTDALLYTVDPEYMHNLMGVESPVMGVVATLISTLLTALLIVAFFAAIHQSSQRKSP